MIGWLLDTNVIAALINPNGAPSVKLWAERQAEERLFISILTIGEYEKGIANLPLEDERRARYQTMLGALENRFAQRVLPLTEKIVRRWGSMSGAIKRTHGHAPPVIDTMLAATAVEHHLYLVTRNVKDVRNLGAAIFDPWSDEASTIRLRSP